MFWRRCLNYIYIYFFFFFFFFFPQEKKKISVFVLYFTLYFFILLNGELWFADITWLEFNVTLILFFLILNLC